MLEYPSIQVMNRVVGAITFDITTRPLYRTVLSWMIDSKFRQWMQVDLFLHEQIVNPHPAVLALALKITAGSKTQEEQMEKIQKYILANFTYVTDLINYGATEKWAKAEEILLKKKDDCDGLNGLFYILARLSGINSMTLFCNLGPVWVKDKWEYHFYCTYFSSKHSPMLYADEKEIGGRMVRVDMTYYPTRDRIVERPSFALQYQAPAGSVRYGKIDYMFNDVGVWKVNA